MALPSSSFPNDDDDDDNDDFDWEAAVMEIDSACANASASNQPDPCRAAPAMPTAGACPKSAGAVGRSRQSTLDRFVDSYGKKDHERSSIPETRPDGGGSNGLRGGDGDAGVAIDLEAANTWIYPVNVPHRDYQFSISRTALFSNTLVALPTGLGKTLIAAVVMYNYFRWFPEGKIVFAAPSRPLVMQQIEACHNIVGIPQDWTIDMTGQMSPPKRLEFWKVKRVFFVTPQVLERDIQSGICSVKQLVCLVIDEAHRASGNYSYCVAVRELMSVPVHLRILALTATPGSKHRTIQNVIDNLCISTLEYRNENDRDVSQYVHDRKLELIEVAMAKEAVGINNFLLEAIHPFVSRLCSLGVLHNRDFTTLSPCELLSSRDKFRLAPPESLAHVKCGEVEGYFGVLITLYHIRKLLSSHGIRPAFEMLDEKLRQGSFARLMSRNEAIHKAKLLMQQSLSHGAPNPKLVKMMDILVDHFKTKDPKDSRVIIFSNFRGSVKDIMDSLSSIGDLVKATEFIGQSSGKNMKGQSQKVQQAVLQKFRSGGFNVIVATSIGEEGLDIMEVDLVICFDANVSPLRMIQRMGRTGRKHDGRVVILACEGFELKGYLKKQASSKAVRKHMNNGGIKSFDFHPSPRMVPHICKPQVKFVELSIEQFIPRGKKVKVDVGSPFPTKMSEAESNLIAKYFPPLKKDTWKPSLIAFPTFQAFPSRVHKVRHSFKTTAMLIDAMQHLQDLSFCNPKKSCLIEVETSNQSPEVLIVERDDEEQDSAYIHLPAHDDDQALVQDKGYDCEGSVKETSNTRDVFHTPDVTIKKPHDHHFLFGEDFVSVNTLGNVLIVAVPVLPQKGSLASKDIATNNDKDFHLNTRNNTLPLKIGAVDNDRLIEQLNDVQEVKFSSKLKCVDEIADEIPGDRGTEEPASLSNESRGTQKDMELSPRLTHFIEEGVVPESPTVEISQYSSKLNNIHDKMIMTDEALFSAILFDTPKKNDTLLPCQMSPKITKFMGVSLKEDTPVGNKELDLVQNRVHESESVRDVPSSPENKEIHTPSANLVDTSSEDWQLKSVEVSRSVQQAPKLKRLRRFGDMISKLPCKTLKDKLNFSVANTCRPTSFSKSNRIESNKGKKEKGKKQINTFVEEEAEVSEDADVSEDEEDNEIDDKYEDSFIDDRVNPTEASTQLENSGGDMMAFYRRSLLTQSPGETLPIFYTTSHESVSSATAGSGSCPSTKIYTTLQTPHAGLQSAIQSTNRNSVTCQLDPEKSTQIIVPGETSSTQKICSNKFESRKRKLSFQHAEHQVPPPHQPGRTEDDASFSDDDFFQGIDLDAVEAQATMSLRCKSELSQRANLNLEGKEDPSTNLCFPSFDLGI